LNGMTMTPGTRKLVLTAHVVTSVGWLGAAAASLALAIAGLTSPDLQLVRAAYLMMEVTARYVLLPLSLASLLTGTIQSLGTRWGLFRHCWIVTKLVINVLGTVILVLYLQSLSDLATIARDLTSSTSSLDVLRSPTVTLRACVALGHLFLATALSIYKPHRLTRLGRRRLLASSMATTPRG
jgi:hypothetical protein